MAKNVIRTSEWYERTTKNGTHQKRRFNAVTQSQSRIVRQMTADAGWVKMAGSPVGVPPAAKPKVKARPPVEVEEQPEQNADEQ